MRIAIFIKGSLKDRKGLLNAALNRVNYLKELDRTNRVDVYCIHSYYNRISCFINRIAYMSQFEDDMVLDGIHIHWLWAKITIWDILKKHLCNVSQDRIDKRCVERLASTFESYDVFSAHGLIAGLAANAIAKNQGKPFFITWHGTDIHTAPFLNSDVFDMTSNLLNRATCNFFVSKALQRQAQTIRQQFKSTILYNGVSDIFYRFSDNKRTGLRQTYGVNDKKVVAFCGNVIDIKNVDVLPELFDRIERQYNGEIMFWIIGDGDKRKHLQDNMKMTNILFWGNVRADDMPALMNCIDVLVVPSKQEGLPLVSLEALACGANVVSSKVGGIPEVVGEENSFSLDGDFIDNMSSRTVEMLNGAVEQHVADIFDWRKTAEKEMEVYKSTINQTL